MAVCVAVIGLPLAACSGPLSAMDPVGPSAEAIAELWWVMLIGASALFAAVMGLLLWSFTRPGYSHNASPKLWLLGGGLVLPGVILAPLLIFALLTGERLLALPGSQNIVHVDAIARQWQWTFRYPDGENGQRTSIDVLHLPVGQPINIRVTSTDVIHSFWVPRLGGKIDAVPGHVNVLRLYASRAGSFRGVSAEFSGSGYTNMEFRVQVHPAETYSDQLRLLIQDTP